MVESIYQDVRYALRSLRRTPAFTIAAVATLAIGIGANTAIFTIVNGVLLRPLPYADAEKLVRVYQANPREGLRYARFSLRDFEDWRVQTQSFAAMAAYDVVPQIFTGRGDPIELGAAYVTGDFFRVLGTLVELGRPLNENDHRQASRNAVISDRFWRAHLAANAEVIGSPILLRGESFTVVGVMQSNFWFPTFDTDVWLPESVLADEAIGPRVRDNRVFEGVARLKEGITLRQAQANLDTAAAQLAADHPRTNAAWGEATVESLRTSIIGQVDRALFAVFAVVGFILLIGCANLANLQLARGTARSTEFAMRIALGARRMRIVRHMVIESLVLSLLGGVLGLLLSVWGVGTLLALSADTLPRMQDVRVDLGVISFVVLLSFVTGLLFGLLPALRVALVEPQHNLNGARGIVGRGRGVRTGLVVAEIALAVVLVMGASLMARSFVALRSVDPGFDPERVLTVSLRLHLPSIPSPEIPRRLTGRRTEIIDRVAALPGVVQVGAIDQFPLRDQGNVFEYFPAGSDRTQDGDKFRADTRYVSPDYILAMGIPLLRGTPLPDPWPPSGTTVPMLIAKGVPLPMLVSETLARRVWPNRDPIGELVDAGWTKAVITGVVGDVRQHRLADAPVSTVYLPQMARLLVTLVVRTAGDPVLLAEPIRQAIREVAPDQPIQSITTLRGVMSESIARDRFFTLLYGIFGGLALLLAAVGVYGVVAYSVGHRTEEIGVRMALGADASHVLRMVVGGGMRPVLTGLALGSLAALPLTRLLESQLYEVSSSDPQTLVTAVFVLLAVALLACTVPAWRAIRISPTVALRAE